MKVLQYNELDIFNIKDIIQTQLEESGYAYIHGIPINLGDYAQIHQEFLAFCQQVGRPILHNFDQDSFVWDIKPVANSTSKYITHSEVNAAASLHSDSSFSNEPEDYFALFSIKKSTCGGGASQIMSAKQFIANIRAMPGGDKTEHTLRSKPYPFKVPDIFKKEKENDFEYNEGYILQDDYIRYRSDCILECIKHESNILDKDQKDALEKVEEMLSKSMGVDEFTLQPGECLFIQNKKVLHGRTAFKDLSRHLLRVRLKR